MGFHLWKMNCEFLIKNKLRIIYYTWQVTQLAKQYLVISSDKDLSNILWMWVPDEFLWLGIIIIISFAFVPEKWTKKNQFIKDLSAN